MGESTDHPRRRILLTGGCNFVGTEQVSLLLARNYQVFMVDDLSNARGRAGAGCGFLQAGSVLRFVENAEKVSSLGGP
jgi:nucleoside-diphosphate-sugar epimerase